MSYGNMEQLLRWLDREAVAAAKERRYRNWMRNKPRPLRRFVRTMRLVVRDIPGPENLHAEKIMERLKIKATRYYELRQEAEQNLV